MNDKELKDLEDRYALIETRWRSKFTDNEKQLNAINKMRNSLDRRKQSSLDTYSESMKELVEYLEMSYDYKESERN